MSEWVSEWMNEWMNEWNLIMRISVETATTFSDVCMSCHPAMHTIAYKSGIFKKECTLQFSTIVDNIHYITFTQMNVTVSFNSLFSIVCLPSSSKLSSIYDIEETSKRLLT